MAVTKSLGGSSPKFETDRAPSRRVEESLQCWILGSNRMHIEPRRNKLLEPEKKGVLYTVALVSVLDRGLILLRYSRGRDAK